MISVFFINVNSCIYYACMQICVYVCVYSVKNALISFKKSANKIYHEKIRQKFWVL